MATCRVSFTNEDGVHSVEVTADTLYEAVALALSEFKDDKTIASQPGEMTEFMVSVIRKPIDHVVKLKRVKEWAQFSNTTSPVELLRRERVRKMLEAKAS
jgi:hypothetical protein